MKAVILAAGEGSRLRPLTIDTPKSLLEVAGMPIIERIFDSLPDGIDEVVVVVGHLKEKLMSYLGQEFLGRKVVCVEQGDKKGTYGALWSVKDLLNTTNEKFLVLGGDDVNSKEDLKKFLLDDGRAFGLQKMVMPNYYSVLVKDEHVEGFRSQTEEEKSLGALIATGVYLLDSEIFDHPGVVVHGGEYGLPQTILAQKSEYPIRVVRTESWLPINSFVDLARANKFFSESPLGTQK